ncbi:MAG TPA: M67 family metallopeptidase [Blastocatellia bacterium]
MNAPSITITREVAAAIAAAAKNASPEECCGLVGGSNGVVTHAYSLRNESPRPETRYFASPEDLLGAMRAIREAGQTLMGIYHSHPRTSAYPSASDVEMAFYPEAVYFIMSLGTCSELRAFKINGDGVQEVDISIQG